MADIEDNTYQDGTKSSRSWREYFMEEITTEWADTILLLGSFSTGLLDSAVYNAWSCFVSMQTGNTIYVGLGMTGQPHDQPNRWIKSGTSILSFILGSFVFSRIMNYLGPSRRISMLASLALQAILTLAAAIIATIYPRLDPTLHSGYLLLLPIALLAMQAGGQCVLSRVLGYNEIPSVVITASICDFAMDTKLLAWDNAKRNRRAASVLLLVAGAGIGGLLTRDGIIERGLWVVVGIKSIMTVVWLFWASKGSIRLE